jgi:hypothetical protein
MLKLAVLYVKSGVSIMLYVCSVPFSTAAWILMGISKGFLQLGNSVSDTI